MKINTKAVSSYLGQDDVREPIVATMDCVTIVPALRNDTVLHFQGGAPKPLPLNLTNKRALVRLYGDDDAGWIGKPIEIYVDADVTNSQGEVTGGVRLRAPQAKPTQAPANGKPARSLEENLRWGLDALDAAKDEDRLDTVAVALGRLPLNAIQAALVERRYTKNLERLGAAPTPVTSPVTGAANPAATATATK